MARAWYSYNGSGDKTQPSSYTLVTVRPSCINGATLCSIYAVNGGNHPASISSNLQDYISDASVTGLAQPQSPSTAKKYVYQRN